MLGSKVENYWCWLAFNYIMILTNNNLDKTLIIETSLILFWGKSYFTHNSEGKMELKWANMFRYFNFTLMEEALSSWRDSMIPPTFLSSLYSNPAPQLPPVGVFYTYSRIPHQCPCAFIHRAPDLRTLSSSPQPVNFSHLSRCFSEPS